MWNQIIEKQKAAKTAGFTYLLTFVLVVTTNFGIYNRLVVPNNVADTAKSIHDHEFLFRIGMIADLTYAIGFIILISSLFYILKEVNVRYVIPAALFQFAYIATWIALTLKSLDTLRFANEAQYLQVFSKEQLAAFTNLLLKNRFDRYYGVLMFYSIGAVFFNYLWLKSKYIPRFLAMWGFIACIWCSFCGISYLLYPPFGKIINIWLFDLPMALFDITLSFWLIIKGLRIEQT